jgi:single-strand DNA-binding protein
MAPLHRVYFLGTLIQDPEMGYAPNGTAVARWGLAVPTRLRQGDTWHADVCCINVVAFGRQAETVGASLRKGRTVLIEGRVQWRRGAQEGPSRCTQEVIAERIQVLARPREGTRAAAGVGRSSSGARPAGVPPAVDALPVSGHGECRDARDVRPTARG